MYKSWSGRVAVLRLQKILVDQSWLGCFPMALPDQLATLAVLLADKRHLEVPAESDRDQGVGHELHPRAFRSHPDMTGHHDEPSPEYHYVCGALPAGCQLEPTTSNEDIETDDKTVMDTIIMIVHVRNGKTEIVCVLRLPFCMAFVVVRAMRMHAPRA